MRALITGIHGFTGHYVASELQEAGCEVWGLGVNPPGDDPRYLQADLEDPSALKDAVARIKPDLVVHLAAIAFVGHDDPQAFYRVNLLGTQNLLSALGACPHQPQGVLLASSANIYGNSREGSLSETTPPDPVNDYAASKLAMEYMARLWFPRLPIVIVRPFNYTGVGQDERFLIPKIVAHYKRRAPVLELGNLDVWRDFSDVRTVAHVYRRLLECRISGCTVNVGSGVTHSLREVLAMAASFSGHEPEIRVNPAFVRKNEVKQLCADIGLLKDLIGDYRHYGLEETLRWMLDDGAPDKP